VKALLHYARIVNVCLTPPIHGANDALRLIATAAACYFILA
jgi:hypothetical protein